MNRLSEVSTGGCAERSSAVLEPLVRSNTQNRRLLICTLIPALYK